MSGAVLVSRKRRSRMRDTESPWHSRATKTKGQAGFCFCAVLPPHILQPKQAKQTTSLGREIFAHGHVADLATDPSAPHIASRQKTWASGADERRSARVCYLNLLQGSGPSVRDGLGGDGCLVAPDLGVAERAVELERRRVLRLDEQQQLRVAPRQHLCLARLLARESESVCCFGQEATRRHIVR